MSKSNYPLHEKLAEMKEHHQAVQDFLAWIDTKGYVIAQYRENSDFPVPTFRKKESIISEFLGIPEAEFEAEKRAMLDALRA